MTTEGGAWYAEEPSPSAPARPARDHLRVVFISDTHGCHGLMQKYFSHPEILGKADVLIMCGDCLEHEGQTAEERGPSLLDDLVPQPSRDLAEWTLGLDIEKKIYCMGNHDGRLVHAETAALQGVKAPMAGAPARDYFAGRGLPSLPLLDETAVIPMGDGRSLIIHATPWQSDIGGLFQYGLGALNRTGVATGLPTDRDFGELTTSMEGNISEKITGDWGVGERSHIVASHSPPFTILDTVTGGFATSDDPSPKGLKPVGCKLLLSKLRQVKPLVSAFGHVHAEQGMDWLKFRSSKAATEWRKAGRAALASGAPYPHPPHPRRGCLRVVQGRDLSQVHASKLPYEETLDESEAGGEPQLTRRALEADFENTLFLNAANLNATTSGNQHGVRYDQRLDKLVRCEKAGRGFDKMTADSRMRVLRPPIVVDVYPEREGEPRGRAVLVPLNIERFPE